MVKRLTISGVDYTNSMAESSTSVPADLVPDVYGEAALDHILPVHGVTPVRSVYPQHFTLKRKDMDSDDIVHSTDRQRGKHAVQSNVSAMHVDGANVTVNHGASGSSIPKCSSDNKRIMTWRGDMWLVEPKFAEQAPAVVTSPMPVRFPACLLASTTEDEPEKEPSEWLLGLVIHSYV